MDLETGASGWFCRHLTRIGSGRIFPVRRRRGAPHQDERNPRASSAVRPVAAIGRAARTTAPPTSPSVAGAAGLRAGRSAELPACGGGIL